MHDRPYCHQYRLRTSTERVCGSLNSQKRYESDSGCSLVVAVPCRASQFNAGGSSGSCGVVWCGGGGGGGCDVMQFDVAAFSKIKLNVPRKPISGVCEGDAMRCDAMRVTLRWNAVLT